MPEIEVTKDIAADSRIRIEMRRDFFNLMVEHGAKIADWEQAFVEGRAKATGVTQYLQLIARVVEKHQERARLRRAHSLAPTPRAARPGVPPTPRRRPAPGARRRGAAPRRPR